MVDQLHILQVLQKKGVAVPFFVKDMHRIAEVGVPALVMWNQQKIMVARYNEIVPALVQTRGARRVYIQQYIPGDEVACGILNMQGRAVPLMPIEAIPREHDAGVPWHITENQIEEIQSLAERAHDAVRAGAHSLVRCIMAHDKKIYVTAIDQNPPLVTTSLFVQSARAAGLTREELKNSI